MTPASPRWMVSSILLCVLLLHAATLYLFTRGFLLTRLSLPNISSCSTCTLPPTHSRVILLIIDALRFDFISPDPPVPPSPHYHHILTLPAQLTYQYPTQSFIFNTFADPPTTTLQRIKGITTGSLPTFVDMGSNFAGSEIAEDSLVLQMVNAGRKVAFMGDDTWTTVYPTSFAHNLSFPYDSFNVEDLHSVDQGVIRHLFPLLEKNVTSSWDFLIGHFLGVDHVAHRLGPAAQTMAAKLTQMNDVLAQVVERMDDETLLVVIGDHGMDRKGDHGGDGEYETSAATWIYSKSLPLSSTSYSPPQILVPRVTFPGATVSHRLIQQIDLVPTLSLLLGLPIPFNNLGSVIPELFTRGDGNVLREALRLNADQVKSYLGAYRASPSGTELDAVWGQLEQAWILATASGNNNAAVASYTFTRLALASCRALWAQFNLVLMCTGLFALAVGNIVLWFFYTVLGSDVGYWEVYGWHLVIKTGIASCLGATVGSLISLVFPELKKFIGIFEAGLTGATLASSFTLLTLIIPKVSLSLSMSKISILLLHALAFLSNSFTLWEDRILTFLLVSSLVPFLIRALTVAQAEARLRRRILSFSIAFAACVRLAGISTVCREEQHPYCRVTFYASSSLPSPPILILLLSIPVSLALPSTVRRVLGISRSDKGIAPLFLEWGLRVVLLAGNACWILEWLESSEIMGNEQARALRTTRTVIARSAMGASLTAGGILWWFSPLCLELHQSTGEPGNKQVQVIGFANSYGSSFLLFALIPFSLLFIATQLTGQITLALLLIALLALSEIVDSARDVRVAEAIASNPQRGLFNWADVHNPTFTEVVPVALLGLHAFYSTGHQSTMPSIQWKTAFLLTPTLTYPISPLLVALNTFGSPFFFALAAPLLAVWNVAPLHVVSSGLDLSRKSQTSTQDVSRVSMNSHILVASLRASLGVSLYFSTLLLSSSASAAWLRRHLMVWKVFAPRFMNAGITILVVDLGVLVGVVIGVGRVVQKVYRTFGNLG